MMGVSFQITPKTYSYEKCDRVSVFCSPWRAMRILGENFGYTLTVTPLSGRVEGPTGERRTEVWTMVSAKKAKIKSQWEFDVYVWFNLT